MTLGRLVSAALAVLLSSACGTSTGNTAGGGSGAGGGGTDGGGSGGDAGTGGDGGSATYTISVRINGNGAVRAGALGIDCRAACDAPGQAGTHVSFLPVADSGWKFDGWGGLCSGNFPCEVVVHGDRTLWATFVPASGFAVELHPTNAKGCEGIMPSSAPVPRSISLELKYSTSQGNWFDGLSVDGLGDVAAEFNSDHSDYPSDERRLVIYDLDGGVVGQVPGGFLKSQPDGFLSQRTAMDYGQAETLYGWTRSASNYLVLDRATQPGVRHIRLSVRPASRQRRARAVLGSGRRHMVAVLRRIDAAFEHPQPNSRRRQARGHRRTRDGHRGWPQRPVLDGYRLRAP